jgi:hypothetical protein
MAAERTEKGAERDKKLAALSKKHDEIRAEMDQLYQEEREEALARAWEVVDKRKRDFTNGGDVESLKKQLTMIVPKTMGVFFHFDQGWVSVYLTPSGHRPFVRYKLDTGDCYGPKSECAVSNAFDFCGFRGKVYKRGESLPLDPGCFY